MRYRDFIGALKPQKRESHENKTMKENEEKAKRKNTPKEQMLINGLGIVILVVIVYFVANEYVEDNRNFENNRQKNIAAQAEKIKPAKQQAKIPLKMPNPFIEIRHFSDGEAREQAVSTYPVKHENQPLPAIPSAYPSFGKGNLNMQNSREGKLPDSVGKIKQTAQAQIQGISINKDGEGMAIMSNGQILSEGDTYQDGRIAYIGGDGIRFSDGRFIKYE